MQKTLKVLTLVLVFFVLLSCTDKGGDNYRPPAFPKEKEGGSTPAPLTPSTITLQSDREIEVLKEIISKDPKNLDALIKLGNISMDSKRFQDAVDAYGRALEIDPRNVDVRVDMGTCYRNLGNPNQAIEEYKKALSYNPNHLYAYKNLGVVLAFDLHREEEAIKAFQTYLKLSPNAPDALQVSDIINDLKKRSGQ